MLKLLLTSMAGRLMSPDPEGQGGGGESAPDPDLQDFANRGMAAQAAADAAVAAVQTSAQEGAGASEESIARLEQDKADREAFPDQAVTVRARDGSQKLGLIVQRQAGGFECEELVPRHAREITLKAGDHLVVVPLQGRDAEEFLRLTQSEPAGDDDLHPAA